jgi:hypothetical protein
MKDLKACFPTHFAKNAKWMGHPAKKKFYTGEGYVEQGL